MQDITPQKSGEEALRDARAQLEKTVEKRTKELANTSRTSVQRPPGTLVNRVTTQAENDRGHVSG